MEKKKKFIINALYISIVCTVIYLAGTYLLPVLTPFIIALIFAMVIVAVRRKVIRSESKWRKQTTIALGILLFAALAGIVILFGNRIIVLVGNLATSLPKWYQDLFLPWLSQFMESLQIKYHIQDYAWYGTLDQLYNDNIQKLGTNISDVSVTVVKTISGYASKLPELVIKIVVCIVSTFFIAIDYEKINAFCIRILPQKVSDAGKMIFQKVKEVVLIYLKSYSVLMLLTFVELCFGFVLLGIQYWYFIALGIAIFDILPILGTGGILIPWTLIAAILGNYKIAIGIFVLYIVITIIRNILEPKIVGRNIGVHPLATLIGLFVGLRLFGFVGMIGFPVALSIFANLERDGVTHFLKPDEINNSQTQNGQNSNI